MTKAIFEHVFLGFHTLNAFKVVIIFASSQPLNLYHGLGKRFKIGNFNIVIFFGKINENLISKKNVWCTILRKNFQNSEKSATIDFFELSPKVGSEGS